MNNSDTAFKFEIALLGMVALSAAILAGLSIKKGDASGAAAWSAILMAIVNSVKEWRSARTIDRMGQSLSDSAPTPQRVTTTTVEGTDDAGAK